MTDLKKKMYLEDRNGATEEFLEKSGARIGISGRP
jgi:hypothetical protein